MFTFDKNSIHTPFIQFVAKAVSKDSMRASLQHIFVPERNTDIVATDGFRCHVYTPDVCPLQPGLYQVLKQTKKEIWLDRVDPSENYPDFPDYTRIVPDSKASTNFKDIDHQSTTIERRYTQLIRAMGDSVSISYSFFSDLPLDLFVDYQIGSANEPILFTGPEVKAVIMPFKMEL